MSGTAIVIPEGTAPEFVSILKANNPGAVVIRAGAVGGPEPKVYSKQTVTTWLDILDGIGNTASAIFAPLWAVRLVVGLVQVGTKAVRQKLNATTEKEDWTLDMIRAEGASIPDPQT